MDKDERELASSLALPTAGNAVTFDLTSDHCTGGCGTAPFGTVEVTQVGANVNFVVDLANGPPNTVSWAQTGPADFQLFKFNATGVVVGDISVTQTFAGQTLQANTGTFNGDGTGPFSFGISCTTCGNGALGITSNLVFTIANATIADVTAGNPLNIFVADVFSSQTGNTGPVDVAIPAAGSRTCCRRWPPRSDLGRRWPSRLVATAAESGLNFRRGAIHRLIATTARLSLATGSHERALDALAALDAIP